MAFTLFHRISEWWRRLDERQQQSTMQAVLSDKQHTCANCGTAYVGRYCPQCGMKANRGRMTAKSVLTGFLEACFDDEADFMDMGSMPMVRSIKELFWRPGYMIRDYLHGHQPLYFPPFKMLVIVTLVFALVCSLRGIEPSADEAFVFGDVFERYGETPWITSLFAKIDKVLIWLHSNPAYQAIAAGIFYILASWVVFRRRMLFFEVVFSQLYISCQMQMVAAVWVLVTGSEAYYNLPPFAVPLVIGIPLLCLDYAQLYGLRLWPVLWRTVLTFLITLTLMLAVAAIPILLVKQF